MGGHIARPCGSILLLFGHLFAFAFAMRPSNSVLLDDRGVPLQRTEREENQTAMNVKNLLVAVSALFIVAIAALAQGPLYDKVIVDLPYTVSIGDKVLKPGNYVIRQNPSDGSGGRVLLIYSNKGRRFETSTM